MGDLLVNIDVPDLPRAVSFYAAAFGLQPARRFGDFAVELAGGTSRIYLLAKEAGSAAFPGGPPRGYARHWTPVHVDFVVDDLHAALRRALDAGATLEGDVLERTWGRLATLADPFGHGVCLVQFLGRGYDELL